MSTALNVAYLQYGSSWAARPFNKGWSRVRGTATLANGSASCTITNVPNLGSDSEILIAQSASPGSATKLIEIAAGKVKGNVGTIQVGTADGSNVTANTNFMFQIINL